MLQAYRSLASASAGEKLAIHKILSKQAAQLCEGLGVREGDALECKSNTASHLILRTESGKVISLGQDWARYIQIA